jgi:hypothetical protein
VGRQGLPLPSQYDQFERQKYTQLHWPPELSSKMADHFAYEKMSDHFELPSNIDDGLHELSTAPTTPDGSLTFSPVLRNVTLDDEISVGNNDAATVMSSSSYSTLKNVCCVGAGYVGMSTLKSNPHPYSPNHPRRPHSSYPRSK